MVLSKNLLHIDTPDSDVHSTYRGAKYHHQRMAASPSSSEAKTPPPTVTGGKGHASPKLCVHNRPFVSHHRTWWNRFGIWQQGLRVRRLSGMQKKIAHGRHNLPRQRIQTGGANYHDCPVFRELHLPRRYAKKKLTGYIRSKAKDLLQQFGGISFATAKKRPNEIFSKRHCQRRNHARWPSAAKKERKKRTKKKR